MLFADVLEVKGRLQVGACNGCINAITVAFEVAHRQDDIARN
jgi:hypothetical protein